MVSLNLGRSPTEGIYVFAGTVFNTFAYSTAIHTAQFDGESWGDEFGKRVLQVLGGSSMPRNAGADGNSLYTIQQRGLCQQGGQSVATYEEAMGYIYIWRNLLL